MKITSERLQAIVDGADVAIWQYHVPSDTMYENAVFLRMLGLQGVAVDPSTIRSRWATNMHPDDKPRVIEMRKRMLAGETDDYAVDYRVKRKGGGWNTLRARVRVVERDDDGNAVWLAGVISDVSGEKELARLLKALFDRPFAFLTLLSPEGVILETNRTTMKSDGVAASDIVGKTMWEGVPAYTPQQRIGIREDVQRAIKGETLRREITLTEADGSMHTRDATLTPLYDDDGKLVNIIAEARDITEFARAREALSTAEERLRTATAGAGIGLYDWKVGSAERWYNDQFFEMLGYQPGDFPGSQDTIRHLCHPEDWQRVTAEMTDYISGRISSFDMEFRLRSKSGEWRWVHSQASAVERDAAGKALRVAGVHIDITDRKNIEMQLASAQRLESIGQLAAGIAHEINTPVQYVNDSIYFVREGVQELLTLVNQLRTQLPAAAPNEDLQYLQENLPAALDRAVDGLTRVSEIVRSMKEFSHPDQKEMELFDVNRGIQSTLVVAKNEYKFYADVETRLEELPPVICHGGAINQVILNLVVNGAHAIAERVKDSGARGRILVASRHDGDEVVISISDTGGGIPESVQHRIFEPFFTTKEVGKGTGQGLAIARNVVRKHGGSLSFQTEIGQGTTFHIRLPIQPPKDSQQVEAA